MTRNIRTLTHEGTGTVHWAVRSWFDPEAVYLPACNAAAQPAAADRITWRSVEQLSCQRCQQAVAGSATYLIRLPRILDWESVAVGADIMEEAGLEDACVALRKLSAAMRDQR